MSKSLFRSVWLILTCMLLLGSYLFVKNGQKAQNKLYRKDAEFARLKIEKQKVASVKSDLEELDKKTISEAEVTQLGILRHLDLEQNEYDLKILSKQEKIFDDTALLIRNIQLETNISYQDTMSLLDKLHAAGKVNLTNIEISRASGVGERVRLVVKGTMYGINKYE